MSAFRDAAENIRQGFLNMWLAMPQGVRDFAKGFALGAPVGAITVALWLS